MGAAPKFRAVKAKCDKNNFTFNPALCDLYVIKLSVRGEARNMGAASSIHDWYTLYVCER